MRTLAEQIGNVGAELSRAKSWEARGDVVSKENALRRALAIIDERMPSGLDVAELKELCRLREAIADRFSDHQQYTVQLTDLIEYCLAFGRRARLEQYK